MSVPDNRTIMIMATEHDDPQDALREAVFSENMMKRPGSTDAVRWPTLCNGILAAGIWDLWYQ